MAADAHTVHVDGTAVRYRVAGEGPPVVLVHGLSGSHRWWRRNIPALAASHRVIAVNLPGFGALMRRARFDLHEAPTLLRAFMAEVGLQRASLVGHSMGGALCARTAARHPAAVERLLLVAPAGLPVARGRLRHVAPLLRTSRHLRPRFGATVAADALRAGPATLWRAGSMLLTQDVRDDLARVTAPALVVWGDRDALVDPAGAEVFAAAIPGARVLMLADTGHVPMVERPGEFNDAALRFLAGEPVGEAYPPASTGQAASTSGPGAE